MLTAWLEALAAVLVAVGGVFVLVAAIGLLRLPDFYMRLHAPTKAATLGLGCLLLAALLVAALQGRFGVAELLITLFVFVTAPVSANVLAQAALHLKVPAVAPPPRRTVPERQQG